MVICHKPPGSVTVLVLPANAVQLLMGAATSPLSTTSYWACGEKTQTVDLPKGGTRTFTGKTHLPTPTKCLWYNNANFLNQAKWVYNIIVNVLPKVDLIIDQQIEWTGSAEYSDVVLPVNSWVEFEDYECGGS